MSIETQDPQTVGAGDMGILGHIAIHALHGAIQGMRAQQAARQAAAPPPAPNPVVKPVVERSAAKIEPAAPRPPVDRYALARAKIFRFSTEALKIAHAIAHVDENSAAAQRAEIEVGWLHEKVARRLEEMGIQQDGHVDTFEEAREHNLDKKLARSQVLLIPSPSGGVDVYGVEPELQRSVAQLLEPSDYETHPASGRIWGVPPAPKMKSRKET